MSTGIRVLIRIVLPSAAAMPAGEVREFGFWSITEPITLPPSAAAADGTADAASGTAGGADATNGNAAEADGGGGAAAAAGKDTSAWGKLFKRRHKKHKKRSAAATAAATEGGDVTAEAATAAAAALDPDAAPALQPEVLRADPSLASDGLFVPSLLLPTQPSDPQHYGLASPVDPNALFAQHSASATVAPPSSPPPPGPASRSASGTPFASPGGGTGGDRNVQSHYLNFKDQDSDGDYETGSSGSSFAGSIPDPLMALPEFDPSDPDAVGPPSAVLRARLASAGSIGLRGECGEGRGGWGGLEGMEREGSGAYVEAVLAEMDAEAAELDGVGPEELAEASGSCREAGSGGQQGSGAGQEDVGGKLPSPRDAAGVEAVGAGAGTGAGTAAAGGGPGLAKSTTWSWFRSGKGKPVEGAAGAAAAAGSAGGEAAGGGVGAAKAGGSGRGGGAGGWKGPQLKPLLPAPVKPKRSSGDATLAITIAVNG